MAKIELDRYEKRVQNRQVETILLALPVHNVEPLVPVQGCSNCKQRRYQYCGSYVGDKLLGRVLHCLPGCYLLFPLVKNSIILYILSFNNLIIIYNSTTVVNILIIAINVHFS